MHKLARILAMPAASVLAVGALAGAAGAVPDTAWRMGAHDPQRTGLAPGTAHLATPAVRWRAPLDAGAAQVVAVDVDLDGADDVVLLGGGRLTARRLTGSVLWKSANLGVTFFSQVDDLHGSGSRELLAFAGRSVHLIDPHTGAVRWTSPEGQYKGIGAVFVADFTGDGTSDLAITEEGSPLGDAVAVTHVFTFAGGTVQPVASTQVPTKDGVFGNGRAIGLADGDGDGLVDIVMAQSATLGLFSAKTGAIIGQSAALGQVSSFPSAVVGVPAAGNGKPLVVVVGDTGHLTNGSAQIGAHVLQLQNGALVQLWQVQATNLQDESFRTVPAAIGDLDGDGVAELFGSHFVDNAWQLQVFDLTTGKLLTQGGIDGVATAAGAPGPVLRGAFLIGKQPVFVCALQKGRTDAVNAPLRLVTWQRGGGFAQLADLGAGGWWPGNLQAAPDANTANKQRLWPMLGLGTALPAPELLVTRDTDGDLRADTLQRLTIGATGSVAVTASRELAPGTHLLTIASGETGLRVVAAGSDGSVPVYNSALTLVNDGDGNGVADLFQRTGGAVALSVAPRMAGGQVVVAATSGTRVLLIDPVGAGPALPPKTLWSVTPSDQFSRANLADTDGDGAQEVVVRVQPAGGNAAIQGYSLAGAAQWSWTWQGPPARWTATFGDPFWAADLDGDGAEELFLATINTVGAAPQQQFSTVLHGKTHQPMWDKLADCGGYVEVGTALDPSSAPPTVVLSSQHERLRCNALTGLLENVRVNPPAGLGVPMLTELDGAPPLEVVLRGPFAAAEADHGDSLQPLWSQPETRAFFGGGALGQVAGQAVALQVLPAQSQIDVRVAATGQLLWARVFVQGQSWPADQAPKHSVTGGGVVTLADLTGKQQPAALLTTSEGLLYAIALDSGAVLWSLDVGGQIATPVPADIDGDGLLELLIATPDGDLIALDSSVATAPAWVREHGPAGLALDDAADLDQQEDASALAANWAAVGNASGYAARLLDDNGGQLVPAQLVDGTDFTFSNLYLQLGRTYYTAVVSHASAGPDATFSAETKSDGIQIVDVSPPWLTGLGCTPNCIAPLGTAVTVHGTAQDKTRLANVRATLVQAGAAVTHRDWPALLPKLDLQWPLPPLPLGAHSVAFAAVDLAGHATLASLPVTICAPEGSTGSPRCADLLGHTAKNGELYGREVNGCASGGSRTPLAWLGVLLGLAAAVSAVRRQRRLCAPRAPRQ